MSELNRAESPQMKAYLRTLLTKTLIIWKRRFKGKFPSDGTMYPILCFNSKRRHHYQSEIIHDSRYEHPKFASVCVFRNGEMNPSEREVIYL